MPKFLEPLVMGNPVLLERSEEVRDVFDPEIKENISDMLYTIQTIGERMGLAAPQVGILKRIVVFRFPANLVHPRYKSVADSKPQEEIPWTAIINPTFTPLSDKIQTGWEVCVSVPGIMAEVDRFENIKFTYLDQNGNFHEREAHGFLARLIQHEFDHLDGILFPMRVKNMQKFGFESELMKNA
jgi:peptide deformylase